MRERNLQRKANIIFFQILGIGLSFLVILLLLGISLYPKLLTISKSLLGRLETICGCTNHFSFINHPFIFTSLILLTLGLVLFFCFSIVKIVKFRNLTTKFIKANLKKKKKNLSVKLKDIIDSVDLEGQLIEIDSRSLVIFCFGWHKPKVCISSGLVNYLSRSELKAVLLHEKHHLDVHEPLKIFIVKLINRILFFVPGLKMLARQYLTFSEMSADQQATNDFQDKVPLARALYKIIKQEEQVSMQNSLALSFFSSITGARVNKLVDNRYIPKFRISPTRLSFSIFLILMIFFLLVFSLLLLANRSLAASHSMASCPIKSTNVDHRCQMLIKEADCSLSYNLDICEMDY
jgi:beta-lactamase regulating signal transducer with metallopeptidase domain